MGRLTKGLTREMFGPMDERVVHPASGDFRCLDCSADTSSTGLNEYYMVSDQVWRRANPGMAGMLCVGCLEARLGRRLRRSDFTDAPTNYDDWNGRSPRLEKRLAA